jgi:hypothetical protein
MNDTQRKAYLLIGSAKGADESTSAALGRYLLDQLGAQGLATELQTVHRALRTPARLQEMLAAIDQADVFLLSFPLYVDTLPYLVTAALEAIAAHRSRGAALATPHFAAICNCGFPEASHCTLALATCALFAQEAHMRWAGGLALGAGGMLNGRRPQPRGMTHTLTLALDSAAKALTDGEPLPPAAAESLAKPLIPNSLYLMMGNLSWHMTARQNGAWTHLWDRPLAP